MKTLVFPIDQLADADIALVGGKAAALGRMHEFGIKVPLAICVTTRAYQSFLAGTGIGEKILLEIERKAFGDMRWEELWDSSLRLRHLFLTTPIQLQLRERLIESIAPIFTKGSVAVRSSAPGEDSSRMSFAGLHESYLNVSGIEDVLDHIRLVWASLFSDRALLYRRELGLDPRKSSMAVVIQEMIVGECSGVAFGMSPFDPHQSVIEAVSGLNQQLVDGLVEPHRWILNRNSGELVSLRAPAAGQSNVNGVVGPSSGQNEATSAPLDEAKTREVFRLLRQTEELFGHPQDVEWTFSGAILFALQSRPITSGETVTGDERRWYLTLRRTFENLLDLRADIENSLIPAMQREASELAAMNLARLSDEDLDREVERRRSIMDHWERMYKDKCIPFAHGMRLFAEVYNDHVRPDDPFEFMELLGTRDMLSVKRNSILQELAQILRQDATSLDCLYDNNITGCSDSVRETMQRFGDAFGDLAWGSESIFTDSRRMASLMHRYIDIGSRDQETNPGKAQRLESDYLASFPEHRTEYAATLLDLARASYRLRDDDNIYMGNIRRQVAEVENEARCRGILGKQGPREGLGMPGTPSCREDSEPVSHHRVMSPIVSQDLFFNVKARQVVGQPAGAGLATGKARVILSSKDLFEFRNREILVCDAIDPNMTFVVPLAAGIVERRGGMLIHGAIIAREYGIPCVTGVPAATEVIRTGDTVTVDGFLGIVIIG